MYVRHKQKKEKQLDVNVKEELIILEVAHRGAILHFSQNSCETY